MAAPFKQVCRRAASTPKPLPQAWTRSLSSTPAPRASQVDDQEVLPALDLSSLPSQAHADLETHREIRGLARKAAWEMPLLSSLSKPFTPPTQATPLRWRYTTYMGEQHPASRKVVVEFAPKDLPDLDDKQRLKLAKLAGVRWNPTTETVKMSCESFETQAQNKRFLGETIAKLLKEVKEGEDAFDDLPLDLRHATNKRMQRKQKALRRARLGRPETGFPVEWRMTPERRAELEARRGAATEAPPALPQPKSEGEGEAESDMPSEAFMATGIDAEAELQTSAQTAQSRPVVSGLDAIEEARKVNVQKVEEPMMAEARAPLAKGKQGRKEMGQRGRPR